jgi:hypothetical protein
MSLFDDTRSKLVYAYVTYGRAAGNNDEVAADRIRILSSMFTSDELDEAGKKLHEWERGKCIEELTNAGLIRSQ